MELLYANKVMKKKEEKPKNKKSHIHSKKKRQFISENTKMYSKL